MVILQIKRGDDSHFLYEMSIHQDVSDCYKSIFAIYNGRIKIARICDEMEQLALHGIMEAAALEKSGSNGESVENNTVVADSYGMEQYVPDGGWNLNVDPSGRRTGRQPNQQMQQVLLTAIHDAKSIAIKTHLSLKEEDIEETLEKLQAAVKIVYPMDLPDHDIIHKHFNGVESSLESSYTSTVEQTEMIDAADAQLWFASKLLERGKKLSEYVGKNEKTKVVLKITKPGSGPPPKEPFMSPKEQQLLISHSYQKAKEIFELEQDDEDTYFDVAWADPSSMKKSFHGLEDVSWKTKILYD